MLKRNEILHIFWIETALTKRGAAFPLINSFYLEIYFDFNVLLQLVSIGFYSLGMKVRVLPIDQHKIS